MSADTEPSLAAILQLAGGLFMLTLVLGFTLFAILLILTIVAVFGVLLIKTTPYSLFAKGAGQLFLEWAGLSVRATALILPLVMAYLYLSGKLDGFIQERLSMYSDNAQESSQSTVRANDSHKPKNPSPQESASQTDQEIPTLDEGEQPDDAGRI